MKDTIEDVLEVSRIAPKRSIENVFLKLSEEVGELAQEINIQNGFLNKPKGKDGIAGEAIDVINCAVDVLYLSNPKITSEEINEIMTNKLNKWKSIIT